MLNFTRMSALPLLRILLISLTSCSNPKPTNTDNSTQPPTFDNAEVVPVPEQILLSEAIARKLEEENEYHGDYWRLYWSGDMGNVPWQEDDLENAARKACNEPGDTLEFLPTVHRHFVPLTISFSVFAMDNAMRTFKTGAVNISKLVDDEEIYRIAIETSLAVRCPNKTMVNWQRMDEEE